MQLCLFWSLHVTHSLFLWLSAVLGFNHLRLNQIVVDTEFYEELIHVEVFA